MPVYTLITFMLSIYVLFLLLLISYMSKLDFDNNSLPFDGLFFLLCHENFVSFLNCQVLCLPRPEDVTPGSIWAYSYGWKSKV